MTSPSSPARRLILLSCLRSCLVPALVAGAGAAAAAQEGVPLGEPRVVEDVQRVLDAYLIGPKAAGELGCTIAWQANALVPDGERMVMVAASPEGVLALNSRNELTLIRATSGDRAWTATAAAAIDRVLAVDLVTEAVDRSYRDDLTVLTDTQFYRLDPETGGTVGRERLRALPSDAPVAFEGHVIYGARSGEAVWLNAATGFVLKASMLDAVGGEPGPIVASPGIGGGFVVFGSARGTVGCFDARTGRPYWRRELLAGVSAQPVVAGPAAFVASEDQYLYAFDLGDGSTLWKYFTQSPLKTAPFVGNDLVVQDVPGEGFVALALDAQGKLGGEVRWRKQGIPGQPIATLPEGRSGSFLFWCGQGRMATVVDARNGDVVRSVALPSVERLSAGSMETGGLVAWSSDGRIERLSPLPKAVAQAPAADAGSMDAAQDSGEESSGDASEG